jgi:hypothetical protein
VRGERQVRGGMWSNWPPASGLIMTETDHATARASRLIKCHWAVISIPDDQDYLSMTYSPSASGPVLYLI